MKHYISWKMLSLLAVAAMLLVAGCGSTATQTKSVLTEVLERGTLRVAIIVPNPGFAVPDSTGKLVGYEADIAELLAEALKVKIEYIYTDSAGRVTLVQTGKADIAIATFTRNLERMKTINFTDPLLQEAVVLVTTVDKTDLNKVSDFNKAGIKVGVATGGTQVEAVKAVLPLAEGVPFPDGDSPLNALLAGQIDATTTGNVVVGQLMQDYPGKLKAVEGSLTPPQDDGIGLAFGDFAWWNYLNVFVHRINSDGTGYTLWRKYFGDSSAGPFSIPPAGSN